MQACVRHYGVSSSGKGKILRYNTMSCSSGSICFGNAAGSLIILHAYFTAEILIGPLFIQRSECVRKKCVESLSL